MSRDRVFEEGPEDRLRLYYERMVEPVPIGVRSKQEWLQRRSAVREKTLQALGLNPLPDRLPPEPHFGGTLEREGYRVRRLYWQTWPRVWAGGWLYEPAEPAEKRAAVLNPHGHRDGGARHPVVQSRLISLARLGYVALAVDSVHAYDYPVGLTPLSVMTLQNMRALDYLQSRPDVDRDRIGVTGASGGAQQAIYLLAVDDRPRAAVLADYSGYFRRILSNEGEADGPCHPVPGIMRFTDLPELCGVFSPRAALYLTVAEDWTAPFPEHELGELRGLYRVWLQPDRLAHRQFAGPDDYTRAMREAMYTWFERELRGNRKAEPVPEPEHGVEAEETLAALDDPPPGDRGEEGILEWYRKRVVAQPPQLESRQSRRNYQDRARAELTEVLGEDTAPAVTLETLFHGEMEPAEASGGPARLVSFRSEADVRVPAVWLPGPGEGPWPAVVALHPEGKAAAVQSRTVRGLHAAGYAVLAPDVRLRGELARDWRENCILWGRPEAGMAARDTRACVEWLFQREDVDPGSIVVLGEGDQGVVALLAAAFDERITGTVADCAGTTYRDGGQGLPLIPNILRVADVPQLASLAAPRPLWLFRVPEERVGFSSRRYYDWTRRTFQSLGEVEALKMSTGGLPEAGALADWLARRIKRARRGQG